VLERDQVDVVRRRSVDLVRPVAAVTPRSDAAFEPERRLEGPDVVEQLLVALWAAEAVGGMAWCVDTAADYAKVRVQFGRPIGQFQAVKHRCADLLLSLELARAAAWDATACDPAERELAAAVARTVVPPAAFDAAKDCIQVLGGIGYTWEHDAHLYLRRSTTLRQVLAPDPARVARLALGGARRSLSVELPAEAEPVRAEVRAFLDELRSKPREVWNREIADAGYLVPYWPAPWGRDAGPVEQLVIDEEFSAAKVRRPHLQVGAWVLPTLIAHGTPEQQERFIGPTLRGELSWCQMFSEPGAGSDLASLATRAERVEGGWSLTGQKVWTTMAHVADWGICLARTGDPDAGTGEGATSDRHRGITCFLVDMRSPGIEVRPLRELTGHELFNEVFLDGVFVPDECVVGGVGRGWEAARTTLANERVSMGSGSSFGPGVESVLQLVRDAGEVSEGVLGQVGELVARAQALAVLGLRSTLRALAGAQPGAEASVRKLLGVEHEQRVQEVGLTLLGPEAAAEEGEAGVWIAGFLGNRALSIAGGTSDVQRNIIAERLLGLPKDP
jgi:alkylation response protein AidB-like acyl-CoA dehydrogenase